MTELNDLYQANEIAFPINFYEVKLPLQHSWIHNQFPVMAYRTLAAIELCQNRENSEDLPLSMRRKNCYVLNHLIYKAGHGYLKRQPRAKYPTAAHTPIRGWPLSVVIMKTRS